MDYNQEDSHVKIHDGGNQNYTQVYQNNNPTTYDGNIYPGETNNQTAEYVKHPYLRIAGLASFSLYILSAFLASVAIFTTFRINTDVGFVASVLYSVLSLWSTAALAVFTTIYLFKEHEETFNRIFHKDVGLLLSVLAFICSISYILDCSYLFKGNEIITNYYAITLLFYNVGLFFCFPIYIKVKENKNLELGSAYGLGSFISVLSCFLTANFIKNLYDTVNKAITDADFKFWYMNSMNLVFFVIAMYIIFSYKDFFFGLGFTGYNLVKIVTEAGTYQTLVPAIFYFVIGLGYTGYIVYKHGRECIGISV